MSSRKYSHKDKEKLAEKISKVTVKRDCVKIFEIMQQDPVISNLENKITVNRNGVFMFFQNFSDDTYNKIDTFLELVNKKRHYYVNSDSETNENDDENVSANNDDLNDYVPYSQDEFPNQKGISPKLKYSNEEKNIIKRCRYNRNINDQNNSEKDIEYREFNLGSLTDSDVMDNTNSNSETKRNSMFKFE